MTAWTPIIVQVAAGAAAFWLGRWRWLGAYAIAVPLFWVVPMFLISAAHCADCGAGFTYLPLAYLVAAIYVKLWLRRRARTRDGASNVA